MESSHDLVPSAGGSAPSSSDPDTQAATLPRWPAWYGPAAFVSALVIASVLGAVLAAATGSVGSHTDQSSPTFTILATLLLDAVMMACAVFFAALTRRPRPWHFGLRRARLGKAVAWSVGGMVGFYLLTAAYTAALHPKGTQTVVQDLGANRGAVSMIAAGLVVIVFAPVAEEFFFRGFFYRALRSRFNVVVAAVIDGLVFGAIHYTGSDTLSILPLLALLGFIFCLIYERVGSLYPVIALHALNNSVAYGAKASGAGAVSAVLFACVLVGCFVIPRLQQRPSTAVS